MSEDGSKFLQGHIYNYSRHLLHTEETPDVLGNFRVKYDPNAENKSSLINNIEYECGSDLARDYQFMINVIQRIKFVCFGTTCILA